jgi:hypothetical protein
VITENLCNLPRCTCCKSSTHSCRCTCIEHACGEIYIIQEAYDSLELGSSLNEELEQVLTD